MSKRRTTAPHTKNFLAVSIDQMNHQSNVFTRVVLFGVVASLLIWLGTLKPKIAGTGPGIVVLRQGSNMSFEPQNARAGAWHITSAGAATNTAAGVTNAAALR